MLLAKTKLNILENAKKKIFLKWKSKENMIKNFATFKKWKYKI